MRVFTEETDSFIPLSLLKTYTLRKASLSYVSDYQFTCTPSNYAGVCLQNTYDYSPFGVSLDGRTVEGDFYRRGFNGMEKDDEVKGEGNSIDFGARMYDSRVGRWWKPDVLTYQFPFNSPYTYCSNNPIVNIDKDGNADIYFNGKWIGSDGVDDNLVMVARNEEVAQLVIKSTKSFEFVAAIGLNNGEQNNNFQALHRDIVKESNNVMKLANKTWKTQAEHIAKLVKNGNQYDLVERASPEEKIINIDGIEKSVGHSSISGDVFIHSHPIGIYINAKGQNVSCNSARPSSVDSEGNGDLAVFEYYSLNIIVGKKGGGDLISRKDNDIVNDPRPLTFEVYDREGKNQMSILYKDVKKFDRRKNEKSKLKFENHHQEQTKTNEK